MGERKVYKSALRSRKWIRQAFMELLREKEFEKITVTDIVNRADINRSTFYAHYPDVRGLVEEIMNEVVEKSVCVVADVNFEDVFENPRPLLRNLTDIGEENMELYRLLLNTEFSLRQVEVIKGVFLDRAASTIDIPEKIRKSSAFQIQMNFFIGGILNTYQQWLQGNPDCTTDEIVEQIANLITSNADTYRSWA